MKKTLLLLFTALVGGVSVANATEITLATNVNDGASLKISAIEDAGGIDTDIVTFYFEDNSGTDHTGWGMGGFAKASEWSTFEENFTGNGTSWTSSCTVARIKEVADTDVGIRIRLYNGAEITKIVINATLTFGEPKEISYDGGGIIAASKFEGLVDTDRIRFTYTVTGDLTGYVNWGIGSIGSTDDPHSVKIADLPASALGDLTYTCKYGDIKPALIATPDGILFKTWNFNSGQATASRKKVEIIKSCIPITFPADKTYVSFSSDKALDFSGLDVEAYTVSALTSTSATLSKATKVPAGTGLILKGAAGATYNVPVVASASSVTNKLQAAVTAKTVAANSAYVLSDGQFKKFTGTEIPAGKAYLLASEITGGAHELALVFGDDVTAIKNIKVGTEDNVYYDLQGRRVLYPTKGLYIVNGKKVILK